jgi:nitrilase
MAYLDRQRFEQRPICPQICNNSLVKDSPEMERIQKAVKQVGISVVLGYSERAGGSIYIAQVGVLL